jgi:hypothetical protein
MLKKLSLIILFLSVFILNTEACFGTEYILYARARGKLGNELNAYWRAVKKDKDISHAAIRDYPPHCSLTGFFPMTETREDYIQAVEDAIEQLGNTPRTITIKGLFQGNQKQALDTIKLSSSYLLAVTQDFMSNASVPQKYLKNAQKYHITLRNHIFKQNVTRKMNKIQSLERKINLFAPVSWSLFLYERDDDGILSVIEEFPL